MIAAEIFNKNNKWFPPPTNPRSTFCSEVTVFAQPAPAQLRRGNQFENPTEILNYPAIKNIKSVLLLLLLQLCHYIIDLGTLQDVIKNVFM